MSPRNPTKLEMADSTEVEARNREVQLLFNIIEPDPEYQPTFTSDEATIRDSTGLEDQVVLARLESYFRFDCSFALAIPLWQLVDELKARIPGWPDDWEPTNH